MKCVQLLCVCWCCLCGAVTCGEVVIEGHSCVSDYRKTITCVLNITQNPVGHTENDYRLDFLWHDIGGTFTCTLVRLYAADESYSCSMHAELQFLDMDSYTISLCHTHGCQDVDSYFKPEQNIQLTTPQYVEVQMTPENLNVTWRSGYEDHEYLDGELCYQLELWHQTSSGRRNKIVLSGIETELASIARSHLEPDALYCVVVRSRPVLTSYGSVWSLWSQPTCWRTEAGEDQDNMLVQLMSSVGSVCVAAGVLLVFIIFSPAARMKIKSWSRTPTPAPFFQPLFKQHEGNLKEWVTPQHDVILKSEMEILEMELVTVVPKTIAKDPEEEQNLQKPTVLECQTSYVGFPGVGVVSPPSHTVCLVDSSYTPLPWPTWEPGVVEEAPVSSPKHFLDISSVDSAVESCGSSCEDSSQSPESSLPTSPMLTSPSLNLSPPCFCQDYCVLNKTLDGVIPVFLPKESGNVPSGD